MKTPDSHDNTNKNHRAQMGIIGLGTQGLIINTHERKWVEQFLGGDALAYVNSLAIETADSSRNYSVSRGQGFPATSLPKENVIILKEHSTRELASNARRFSTTRRYAEKLDLLPDVTTLEGAGGHKILSMTAILAELPTVDQGIRKLMTAEMDRCRYNARCDEGSATSTAECLDIYLVGSLYGSTFAGSVVLIASRVHHVAKLLGIKVNVHVIATTPSVAQTHDPVSAWANFGATCKELMLAQDDASKIVFHDFCGNTISHPTRARLLESVVFWGSSTGQLVAGDREEVASSIGLLLFYLAHSKLGGLSSASFCDAQKTMLDRSLGFRGVGRVGIARFAINRDSNREVAFNSALKAVSRMINPDSKN